MQDIAQCWFSLWNGGTATLEPLAAAAAVVHAVSIGQPADGPRLGGAALGDWIARAGNSDEDHVVADGQVSDQVVGCD